MKNRKNLENWPFLRLVCVWGFIHILFQKSYLLSHNSIISVGFWVNFSFEITCKTRIEKTQLRRYPITIPIHRVFPPNSQLNPIILYPNPWVPNPWDPITETKRAKKPPNYDPILGFWTQFPIIGTHPILGLQPLCKKAIFDLWTLTFLDFVSKAQ